VNHLPDQTWFTRPDSYRQHLETFNRILLFFPSMIFGGRNMQSHSLPTQAVLVILFFSLIAIILFLLALQKALKKCAPASRTMEPGTVWLMLIPFFGLVWQFIVVMNIAKSMGNEFERLGIDRPEPTMSQTIGLAMCVCNCCIFIPMLGGLAGIVGLVLWIVYWIRIAKYSRVLDAHQTIALASPIA
jgi:hypothetical protein